MAIDLLRLCFFTIRIVLSSTSKLLQDDNGMPLLRVRRPDTDQQHGPLVWEGRSSYSISFYVVRDTDFNPLLYSTPQDRPALPCQTP